MITHHTSQPDHDLTDFESESTIIRRLRVVAVKTMYPWRVITFWMDGETEPETRVYWRAKR